MSLVDKDGDTTKNEVKYSVVYRSACAFHNFIKSPLIVSIWVLVCCPPYLFVDIPVHVFVMFCLVSVTDSDHVYPPQLPMLFAVHMSSLSTDTPINVMVCNSLCARHSY